MLLHTSLRSRCSRVFMSSDLIRSLRAVSRSSSSSLMRDTIAAMRSFIWPRSAVCRSTTSWSSLTFPNTGSDSSSWFCEPSEALCRAYTDTHSSGSFQSTLWTKEKTLKGLLKKKNQVRPVNALLNYVIQRCVRHAEILPPSWPFHTITHTHTPLWTLTLPLVLGVFSELWLTSLVPSASPLLWLLCSLWYAN